MLIDAVSTATGPFAPAFSISLGTTTGYSISQLAEQLRIESERQSGKQISQEEESLRMGQVGTIGAVASAAPFAIGYGGKLFIATPQGNKIIFKETTEQVGKNIGKEVVGQIGGKTINVVNIPKFNNLQEYGKWIQSTLSPNKKTRSYLTNHTDISKPNFVGEKSISLDLTGASHYNKKTQTLYETPHLEIRTSYSSPNGLVWKYENKSGTLKELDQVVSNLSK